MMPKRSKPKSVPRRVALALTVVFATAAAGTVAFLFLRGQVDDASVLLRPDSPELVALGSSVYAEHCAACHGGRLEGQPDWKSPDAEGYLPAPPHDESGHTWHHPDQVLFAVTKLGIAKAANLDGYRTRMPAYEGVLTDRQILAVLSYIKAQWPEDVRRRHDELNRRTAVAR